MAESRYSFKATTPDPFYIGQAHALFLENLSYAYSRNYGDHRMLTTTVCLIMHATSHYPITSYSHSTSTDGVTSHMQGVVIRDADIMIALIFALHIYGFEIGQQPAQAFTPVRTMSLLSTIRLRDIRQAVSIVRETRNTGDDQLPRNFSRLFTILHKFRYYDLK